MPVRVSIICDNAVGRPLPAVGEHGFSCLIETAGEAWLFDAGRSEALLHNLSVLGHNPNRLKGIVLSHGHNDHTGGLLPLLREIGPRPVYAHPEIFSCRYWQGRYERREVSIPHSREELVRAGARFCWRDTFCELHEDLFYSGEVPREHAAETGDPHLVCGENTEQADPFADDAAVAVRSQRGLVIVLGCAHAGLINTVEHFRRQLDEPRLHAIVGGTHLGPASDAQFQATLDYLDTLQFDRLGVSHCTGQIRSAQLFARYPNKVYFASVGSSLEA